MEQSSNFEDMEEVFKDLSMIVRDHIKDTTYNVTEYCKKKNVGIN